MVVQLYNVVNMLFNKDSNLLVMNSSIYVKHTTCFEQITVLYSFVKLLVNISHEKDSVLIQ